jgi:hypothetical protein
VCDRSANTPYTEDIEALYDPSKERLRDANYSIDLELARVKRSL